MDCGQIPLVAMKQQPLRPTGRHCRLLPVLYTSTTLWFLRTAPIALAIPSPLTTSQQQQQQHQRGISTNNNSNMSASSTKDTDQLGGGAINEKQRTLGDDTASNTRHFDPLTQKSHLWHALEGLDRYPNYLSRWNDQDAQLLEDALQERLEKVRAQRQTIASRRQGLDQLVQRLLEREPHFETLLTPPSTWSELLCQNVKSTATNDGTDKTILAKQAIQALSTSRHFRGMTTTTTTTTMPSFSVQSVLSGQHRLALEPHVLEDLLDEEMDGVYSLPLLSPSFCHKIRQYCQALAKLAHQDEPETFAYLQVGTRAISFDTVGLGWINDLILQVFLQSIAQHLFPPNINENDNNAILDWRQGYVAGYAATPSAQTATPRQQLNIHTDDSEVTLNLCLGQDFSGGQLVLYGLRGQDNAAVPQLEYTHQLGRAVVHSGRHFHAVTAVTEGERHVYIQWARAWGGTRAYSCPCCWLNGRDGDCICGNRWN